MIKSTELTPEFVRAAKGYKMDSFILGHSMSAFCEDMEDVCESLADADPREYNLKSVKAGFAYGAGDTGINSAMDKYELENM